MGGLMPKQACFSGALAVYSLASVKYIVPPQSRRLETTSSFPQLRNSRTPFVF